jgi:hypothetical protein
MRFCNKIRIKCLFPYKLSHAIYILLYLSFMKKVITDYFGEALVVCCGPRRPAVEDSSGIHREH